MKQINKLNYEKYAFTYLHLTTRNDIVREVKIFFAIVYYF